MNALHLTFIVFLLSGVRGEAPGKNCMQMYKLRMMFVDQLYVSLLKTEPVYNRSMCAMRCILNSIICTVQVQQWQL